MQKKIFNMLSSTDRVEYLLRKHDGEVDSNYGMQLLIMIWIAASILFTLGDMERGLAAVTFGIGAYIIWWVFGIILNSFNSLKLDKEFTDKALEGKIK